MPTKHQMYPIWSTAYFKCGMCASTTKIHCILNKIRWSLEIASGKSPHTNSRMTREYGRMGRMLLKCSSPSRHDRLHCTAAERDESLLFLVMSTVFFVSLWISAPWSLSKYEYSSTTENVCKLLYCCVYCYCCRALLLHVLLKTPTPV